MNKQLISPVRGQSKLCKSNELVLTLILTFSISFSLLRYYILAQDTLEFWCIKKFCGLSGTSPESQLNGDVIYITVRQKVVRLINCFRRKKFMAITL